MRLDRICSELQECFIQLRHWMFPGLYNQELFENTIEQIKVCEKYGKEYFAEFLH